MPIPQLRLSWLQTGDVGPPDAPAAVIWRHLKLALARAGWPADQTAPLEAAKATAPVTLGRIDALREEPARQDAAFSLTVSEGDEAPRRQGPDGGTGLDLRLIAASRWARARMVANGAAPDRVIVVPHGVDARELAPPSLPEREVIRRQLGVRDGEVLLFARIGADHHAAGLDLLLRGFARVRQRGRRVRLLLHALSGAEPPDFSESLRLAGAGEAGSAVAEAGEAIIVLPAPLARVQLRLLHGAADAFVSPYRDSWFNLPVLESIAAGTPVVVSAGGPTDDVCGDDVAWRIAAAESLPGPGGGAGGGLVPDVDALTEALDAVARGQGFDRARFARARLRVLRDFSWDAAASRLMAELRDGADAAPGVAAAPMVGLVARPRAPGALTEDVADGRPWDRRRPAGAAPSCLSVVVQGPCSRIGGAGGTPTIDACLASIRRHFPGAQIIVSTWDGSDIDGLDADDIVLSQDPGGLAHQVQATCNINRMLTSTANGLAAATRPFCIKTRSDVMFRADTLATRDLWRASSALSLERRIWTTSLGTWRVTEYLRAFHVGDMVQYGATDDLIRLWDAPPQTWADMFLPDPNAGLPRMCPEQALLTGYLRGLGTSIDLDITCDGRWEVLGASMDLILGGFDVFDERADGVVFPQRLAVVRQMLPPETPQSLERLRRAARRDREVTLRQVFVAFHARLHHHLGQTEDSGARPAA